MVGLNSNYLSILLCEIEMKRRVEAHTTISNDEIELPDSIRFALGIISAEVRDALR